MSTSPMQCRPRRRCARAGAGRAGLAARLAMLLGLAGCAGLGLPPSSHHGLHVVRMPDPSDTERYCAWFGDSDGRTLYTGLSPFWYAMRNADGDPRADLQHPGPQWVGRFDLAEERWLPPLDVGVPEARTGVWDVLATADDGVYFTVFEETSGRVDPASGEVQHFEAAGSGLNELAPGPEGRVLVSRYGGGDGGKAGGELLTLERDGRIAQRWPMPAPLGWFAAPKTPAWNPARRRLVATSDLLPEFDGDPRQGTYAYALDEPGWGIESEPELQFVTVEGDVEYRVEAHADGRLWLRRIRPPGAEPSDQWVLLDASFPAALDFAQDLKVMDDGRLVVTRWSGNVHVVAPNGHVEHVALPRIEPNGLYYTAVIHEERLCASYCAGATVVCTDAPPHGPQAHAP